MSDKEEKLTYKQQRFVYYYTTSAKCNSFKAYKMAGYTAINEDAQRAAASRLRSNVNISNAIDEVLKKEHENNIELKTKIRRKYEKIAFLTLDKFLVWGAVPVDGSKFDQSFVVLKNLEDVEPEYLDCIKKVKQTNQGYEIELYSAIEAMAELRKMYGFDMPLKQETTISLEAAVIDKMNEMSDMWMKASLNEKADSST